MGICYVSKAQELRDSLEDDRHKLTKSDANRIKALYQEARDWLLRTAGLDENRQLSEWKKILDQVNKVLGL